MHGWCLVNLRPCPWGILQRCFLSHWGWVRFCQLWATLMASAMISAAIGPKMKNIITQSINFTLFVLADLLLFFAELLEKFVGFLDILLLLVHKQIGQLVQLHEESLIGVLQGLPLGLQLLYLLVPVLQHFPFCDGGGGAFPVRPPSQLLLGQHLAQRVLRSLQLFFQLDDLFVLAVDDLVEIGFIIFLRRALVILLLGLILAHCDLAYADPENICWLVCLFLVLGTLCRNCWR